MIDQAQLIVNRLLIEDEINDFDMISEIDNLPPAEYWAVCAEPAYRWPQWVYVVLPTPEFKNPVGAVVEPDSPTGREVVQAALKNGLNPDYILYISVIRKITRREYQERTDDFQNGLPER